MAHQTSPQSKSGVIDSISDEERLMIKQLLSRCASPSITFITEDILFDINPMYGSMRWMNLLRRAGAAGLIHRVEFGYMLEVRS